MKSTASPWTVKFNLKHKDWVIYGADGYSITGISQDPVNGRLKEDEANVHLIAAAPEMQMVLQMFVQTIEKIPVNLIPRFAVIHQYADAALKKSRGEK